MNAPEQLLRLPSREGWKARLELGYRFDQEQGRTVPSIRRHEGPLRVQKVYHPEAPHAPSALHQYIVHPPGGVVAGDELGIQVTLEPRSHALLTTPGATKWYRASTQAKPAVQHIELNVDDAILEWLPLENIVFPGANLDNRLNIKASIGSTVFASEMTSFGLPTRQLAFHQGQWRQGLRLTIDDELVFSEQGTLIGDDPVLTHQIGMNSLPILGQLIAYAPMQARTLAQSDVIDGCRKALDALSLPIDRVSYAMSCLPFPSERASFMMLRCRCASVPEASALIRCVWAVLRQHWLGFPAHHPRIWST